MNKKYLTIGLICLLLSNCAALNTNATHRRPSEPAEHTRLLRNNKFGYELQYSDEWHAIILEQIGGISPIDSDRTDIYRGNLNNSSYSMLRIALLHNICTAQTTQYNSNDCVNIDSYANQMWQFDRSGKCADTTSALKKLLIGGHTSFRIDKKIGCLRTEHDGFFGTGIEKPNDPNSFIVTHANGQWYLLWFRTEDENEIQPLLSTMNFFPPCGIEDMPPCAPGALESGEYEREGTVWKSTSNTSSRKSQYERQMKPVNNGYESDCFHRVIIKDYKLNPVFCPDNKQKRLFRNDLFSIQLPGDTFREGGTDDNDGQVAFQTNSYLDHALPSDFTMNISYFSDPSPCNRNMRDVSVLKTEDKHEEQRMWGKVNTQSQSYIDNSFHLNGYYPLVCMPINKTTDIAYAFCAEKNGKQAVICLTQVTDNPKLAEEIFGTFRWTK